MKVLTVTWQYSFRMEHLANLLHNDSIWSEGVRLNHKIPHINLLKCSTLKIPDTKIPAKFSGELHLEIDNTYATHVMIEYHEMGESLHNYLMDWSSTDFLGAGTKQVLLFVLRLRRNTHLVDTSN